MRIHAPEIEDENWCPRVVRDGLTGFLQVTAELLRVYDAATPAIAGLLQRHRGSRVVDLCSGGGGPVVRLRGILARDHDVDVAVVLTDLFPNHAAFAAAAARDPRIIGRVEPVDATDVPAELDGVRTVINGFHHLRPELARRLVEDAARKRQPFISVEVVERRWQTVLLLMGTPLLALLVSPLQRPLTASRLALTWLLPVIPFGVWWDGMCSCLRSYDVGELEAVVDGLSDEHYAFRIERVPAGWLPLRLTMLIGEPTAPVV